MNPKSILGCALLILITTQCATSSGSNVWLEHSCLGKKVVFTEKSFTHNESWNGVGEPPLTVGQAIKHSQILLEKVYPQKRWSLAEVKLENYGEQDSWFYIVTMNLEPPKNQSVGGTGIGEAARIVVSMEGKCLTPR
jgi:hypothetical protein